MGQGSTCNGESLEQTAIATIRQVERIKQLGEVLDEFFKIEREE